MEPLALLDGLEIKLRQLAARTERQRADHARLLAENQELKRELDRQTGIVSSLQDKLARDHAELADSELSRERRETITACLEEVDRCLAWLRNS